MCTEKAFDLLQFLMIRNLDELEKSREFTCIVIPAPYQIRDKLQPESSIFNRFWTPALAGVTRFWIFSESINLDFFKKPVAYDV